MLFSKKFSEKNFSKNDKTIRSYLENALENNRDVLTFINKMWQYHEKVKFFMISMML